MKQADSGPDPALVLGTATIRASQLLALSHAELGRVIGLSKSTIGRIAKGDRGIDPQSKQGQLSLLLVRLLKALEALIGRDEDQRRAWFHSHNMALDGVPASLIQSPQGLVNAVDYLENMYANQFGMTGPGVASARPQTPGADIAGRLQPATKPTAIPKPQANRSGSNILIKPLRGQEAVELMKKVGIFTPTGRVSKGYK